jgi:hypothetical protein
MIPGQPRDLVLPSAGGTVPAGGTLSGVGSVQGSLTNSGTLSPGSSAGSIGVQGPFVPTAGGRLTMEIGDAATNQFDRRICTAGITLAGTLDVRILRGFVPAPGEQFTWITRGARTGTRATIRTATAETVRTAKVVPVK